MSSLSNPAPDADGAPLTAADLARFKEELLAQLQGAGLAGVRPIPLDQFIPEFLSPYDSPSHSRSTRSRYRHVLRLVADLAGPGATTEALTPELLSRLVAARGPEANPFTTNGILVAVRTACNYAVKQGYLRTSPFHLRRPWVRCPAPGVAARKHHSFEAIGRVLDLARADIDRKRPGSPSQWRARRLHALVSLAAYTGMRRNEMLHLRVEDLDLPGRVLRIVPREKNRLKTERSAQPIPMPEPLAAILAAWVPFLAVAPGAPGRSVARGPVPRANPEGVPDPGWLIPNAYRTGPWIGGPAGHRPIDRLKRLGARCGIEGLTFLSLTHSWATHAESRWGLSDLQIQRVLRHTTTKTQLHYRHADLPNLQDALRGVGFGGESAAVVPPSPAPPVEAAPPPPSRPIDPKNPSRPGVWHAPKLSDADVAEARMLRLRGWNYSQLRARYGVSKSTLSVMLNGLTHRHVPPADPPAAGV